MFREVRVVKWKIVYTNQARKDAKKLSTSGLKTKAEILLKLLEENPLKTPPPVEKLLGDLSGVFSRRINIQHRIVYQIEKKRKNCKSFEVVDAL